MHRPVDRYVVDFVPVVGAAAAAGAAAPESADFAAPVSPTPLLALADLSSFFALSLLLPSAEVISMPEAVFSLPAV